MDIQASPKKKRCPSTTIGDDLLVTPKKLRVQSYVLPTPSSSSASSSPTKYNSKKSKKAELPLELQRLLNLQVTLQHALSHALAISGISPTEDKGRIPNVINHLSLLKHGYNLDDLCRLCWLWRWNPADPSSVGQDQTDKEENPFMESQEGEGKDWCQGYSGIILTSATHFSKDVGKRIAVYGIGIEVEMDINKGFYDGMAAVARWTADSLERKESMQRKLANWYELHSAETPFPLPPKKTLPALKQTAALKNFTLLKSRTISRSPSPTKSRDAIIPSLALGKSSSPVKKQFINQTEPPLELPERIPFPPSLSSEVVPQTPSSKTPVGDVFDTPSSRLTTSNEMQDHRTPTSERRTALYERIRQRSLSNTPSSPVKGSVLKEGLRAMSAALMRRRCLLGRLPNIAESIWMLFSGPASSSQERRALRLFAVVHSVVKSSPVPISNADAEESIGLLIELCPFFLQRLVIGREDWLEMPAPDNAPEGAEVRGIAETNDINKPVTCVSPPPATASPKRICVPTSPGLLSKRPIDPGLLQKSPARMVNGPRSNLRLVRERIRRELESYD